MRPKFVEELADEACDAAEKALDDGECFDACDIVDMLVPLDVDIHPKDYGYAVSRVEEIIYLIQEETDAQETN